MDKKRLEKLQKKRLSHETKVSREVWISLVNMDKDHKYNKLCDCYFISEEKIKNKTYPDLRRISVRDAKTGQMYCIKYVLFFNEQGKLDIDVANPYFCKIYKI